MKVLVACEESQEVCKAFRAKGHEAYSADLQDCSGGHPEWHIKGDVLPLLDGNCTFITVGGVWVHIEGRWDLIIAHPPCTFLTITGNRWFDVEKYGKKAEERWRQRVESAVFFMRFVSADCEHIVIENPIGVMSTAYRKADQIIQPYEYGHHAQKSTCLWLKNVPKLKPTNIVDPGAKDKHGLSIGASASYARDENGKMIPWNDPRTAKIRSRTYSGIALAMSEQWDFLKGDKS